MVYLHHMKVSDFLIKRGIKMGETLTAPNNPAVLAYLKAARDGKGLADKVLKGLNKDKKSQ